MKRIYDVSLQPALLNYGILKPPFDLSELNVASAPIFSCLPHQ
jgi:hypothetical protein